MAIEAEKIIPHSASEIVGAYASRAFHEHLSHKVGSELKSFEVNGTPESGFTVVTQQAMSTDRLPEVAKKVVRGGTISVTVTDKWGAPDEAGSRRADTTVEIAGVPVSGTAAQTLHARSDAETKSVVRGDVSVKIPLIGGKVKSAAEPYIGRFVEIQAKEVSTFIDSRK
ncbi:DUF2505 domain-containing protein [Nesterenkonia populi]|uniref:DUF2505 domain-containing protein n=1 Tax=Nesterenkonia populi TaxID=1591087 RepID=UPI0011BF2668|nr:DUF2505 domain-containing protein [Nesterenkonia populi]